MIDCIWNTRVRKHNLRGSERHTEHDNSEIKLNCISVWHFTTLRKKIRMNELVVMMRSISSGICTTSWTRKRNQFSI